MENNFVDETNIPYTQVPNELLYSPTISFKAKGLWAYMHAKPKGWYFAADRIALETKESTDSIRSGLRELTEHGFLIAKRQGDGRFLYILTMPVEKYKTTTSHVENPVENSENVEPNRENPEMDIDPSRENPLKGKSLEGKIPTIINKERNKKRDKQIGHKHNEPSSDLGDRPSEAPNQHRPYRSNYETQEAYEQAIYAWRGC